MPPLIVTRGVVKYPPPEVNKSIAISSPVSKSILAAAVALISPSTAPSMVIVGSLVYPLPGLVMIIDAILLNLLAYHVGYS